MLDILLLILGVYCGVLFGAVPLKTTSRWEMHYFRGKIRNPAVTMGDPAVWLLKLYPRMLERRRHVLNPRSVRRRGQLEALTALQGASRRVFLSGSPAAVGGPGEPSSARRAAALTGSRGKRVFL